MVVCGTYLVNFCGCFYLFVGTSYQAMNERLVRGESNTNVPFPAQGPGGSTPGDTPMSAGQTSGLLADSTSGVRNGATPGQ